MSIEDGAMRQLPVPLHGVTQPELCRTAQMHRWRRSKLKLLLR